MQKHKLSLADIPAFDMAREFMLLSDEYSQKVRRGDGEGDLQHAGLEQRQGNGPCGGVFRAGSTCSSAVTLAQNVGDFEAALTTDCSFGPRRVQMVQSAIDFSNLRVEVQDG